MSTANDREVGAKRRMEKFVGEIARPFCPDLWLDLMLFAQKAERVRGVESAGQVKWVGFATDIEGRNRDGGGGRRVINPVLAIGESFYVLVGEEESRAAVGLTTKPGEMWRDYWEVGGLVEYFRVEPEGWLHAIYDGHGGELLTITENGGVELLPDNRGDFERALSTFLRQDRENAGMQQALAKDNSGSLKIAKRRGKFWTRALEEGGMTRRQQISSW